MNLFRNGSLVTLMSLTMLFALACSEAQAAKKRASKSYSQSMLVPPPPPTAVSPLVLASYPTGMTHMGSTFHFPPAKPRALSERMRLTGVIDDCAFFKVNTDESVMLKEGTSFQNVKLAQITPDSVVLEEKGKQVTIRLR